MDFTIDRNGAMEEFLCQACLAQPCGTHDGETPRLAGDRFLQRLVKAGLLQSQHGTNGGYRLARAAHTISAFEVIQAIDGPLFITSCVTVRGECGQSDRCNIREPLRKVNESIEAVLKRIKISHMREEPEAAEGAAVKPIELVTIV